MALTASDANPIQFWVLSSPGNIASPQNVNWQGTFNTEEKDPVLFAQPYCHVIKSDDLFRFEFNYELSARFRVIDQDGAVLENVELTVYSGNQRYVVIDMADYPGCTKVLFLVVNTAETLILAASDYCEVKTNIVKKSLLIAYSNDLDYAGLTSGVTYYLRVPASFFKGRFPEEVETDSESDGSVISLSSEVKVQRLLETIKLPDYMHLKIQQVLKFSNVTINGSNWKQEETYSIQDGYAFTEFRAGKVWMTKDGSVTRNVLSSEYES